MPASQPASQPGPRLSDLSPEWRVIVEALRVGSTQLVLRLAALEQHGQIGPEAAKAYSDWVARVNAALANVPTATQE